MDHAEQRALRTIAHGSSESVKLRLFAKKASGVGVLTDEEFERELRQLAAQSVMEASDADLEAWLAASAAAEGANHGDREQGTSLSFTQDTPQAENLLVR